MSSKDENGRMTRARRTSLETSGWRVGTVREFLGLSAQEAALVEIRLALARGLRVRRLHSGLTQAALARRLRSSQSRVAKMEAGDPSVSLDLLVRTLLALGTSRRELARIIATRAA